MRKALVSAATALVAVAASPALAAGTTPLDYSEMTGAVDLASTIGAIMTIGGIVILVAVAIMGVRKVRSMVK